MLFLIWTCLDCGPTIKICNKNDSNYFGKTRRAGQPRAFVVLTMSITNVNTNKISMKKLTKPMVGHGWHLDSDNGDSDFNSDRNWGGGIKKHEIYSKTQYKKNKCGTRDTNRGDNTTVDGTRRVRQLAFSDRFS